MKKVNRKIRKAVKEKWIAALRSGEYKQCRGQLKRKDRFCVLGVLCDLFTKTKAGKQFKKEWDNDKTINMQGMKLPDVVREWAEIHNENIDPYAPSHNPIMKLMEHNDEGKRFKTLAKEIEENF